MKTPASRRMIPFIIALSFFLEAVDSTVLNTAIPSMSRSLHIEPVDLKVALISYLISIAIFIPISGWLSDKWGSKRIFISALLIFTISSLACGFAQTQIELVIGRFMQGIGGALGLPVGRLILIRTFGRGNFINSMNTVVMIGAVGLMLGPVIGGIITYHFSWHWIFWINIPIGILASLLACYYLQESAPIKVPPLDLKGFILFSLSLGGFTFGFSALSETSVRFGLACSIVAISLLIFIYYGMHSRNQPHPIVKSDLLKIRTFNIAVIGNLICRLGFGGIPFLIPLLLQIDLKFSAQLSGLLLAPTALGVFLSKPFILPLLRITGYKRLLVINTLSAALMIGAFTIITSHTSVYVIAILTFLYGLILSLQYSAINSLAYADLTECDLSAANSIMSTLQQIAQSFGVAASALLIRFFSLIYSTDSVLTSHIFHATFAALAFFTLLSSLLFIKLQPQDGQQMLSGF